MLSLLEAKTVSRWPHVAKTLFFARNFKDFMGRLGPPRQAALVGQAECAGLPKGNLALLAELGSGINTAGARRLARRSVLSGFRCKVRVRALRSLLVA